MSLGYSIIWGVVGFFVSPGQFACYRWRSIHTLVGAVKDGALNCLEM